MKDNDISDGSDGQFKAGEPMKAPYGPGDRVWYDDAAGVIVRRTTDRPSGGEMYVVRWAGGDRTTVVWGSDLVPHGEV